MYDTQCANVSVKFQNMHGKNVRVKILVCKCKWFTLT